MAGRVFLDTGIFIAWVNPRDRYHGQARELVRSIREGRWAGAETNEHVLVEALNWVRAKIPHPAPAQQILRLGFGTEGAEGLVSSVHRAGSSRFEEAVQVYFRYADQHLSFTDCTVLASMRALGVKTLATFDTRFRGIVDVVPGQDS